MSNQDELDENFFLAAGDGKLDLVKDYVSQGANINAKLYVKYSFFFFF